MFAKGRNMMQAHIDETAIVLERLLFEVPQQIEAAFQNLEQKISNEAMAIAEGDSAVFHSIQSTLFEYSRVDDKTIMLNQFYQSMVILVNSFYETSLSRLVKENKIPLKVGKGKSKVIQKIDSIRIYLEKPSPYEDIEQKIKNEFSKIRNEIVHNEFSLEVNVTSEFIVQNLKNIRQVLRYYADALDEYAKK